MTNSIMVIERDRNEIYSHNMSKLSTNKLSHLNAAGEVHMVDVSEKNITSRTAIAKSTIECGDAVMQQLRDNNNPKGDVFATARIAGIQAAKKCSDLIPLCHPLPLTKVSIDITVLDNGLEIMSTCKTDGKTGVEMEALTAASIAALTIYDMCKAVDKAMIIRDTRLLEKTGGKSGHFKASGN